jgi:hypothetical protein
VTTPLTSQTINMNAEVYRLASASAHTPEPVSFGNVHVGDIKTQTLTISNTAANDSYSEKLNASIGSATAGVTATGSFTLLGAGSTDSTSLVVGLDTSTVGNKSGTATITLTSDGSGTSGLGTTSLTPQTVNVSGAVYRLASASAHTPEPVSFGNVHVGDIKTQALTIQNTAANDNFSEKLNASIGSATAGITATGSFNLLAPQATNNSSLVVGLNTATAGAKSGTATITLTSDGSGTSGLGTTGIGTQTVNVSGNVYRLAQATINNAASFNFGNVLVNSGAITRTISISNTATADGFSEALNAAFGSFTNNGAGIFSNNGVSITGLLAGQTDASAMKVTMTPTSAGTISASVQLLFKSNGTAIGNGLGLTDLPSQGLPLNVTITGVAGNLAIASAATPNPVNFGKFRVGDPAPAQQALTIGNLATAPAEGLNASIATGSPGFTATGSFTSLAPAATDSSTLKVGFTDTASAGAKAGTATITLASDGTFNGGVTTPLTSQTINMNAEVYRLANPILNTPSIAMVARVGDPSPSANISVTNSSPDIYTEGLKASINTVPAGFTNVGGNIGNLAAQGIDASTLKIGLVTTTAGSFSGNATLTLASTGAGTTGAPDQSLSGQNVALNGKVYTPAVANVGTTNINFGIVHVGDVVPASAGNIAVTNGAAVTALNDVLIGTISASPSPFSASGNLGAGLGAGQMNNTSLNVGLNTNTAGVFSGQANLALSSHNAEMVDWTLTTTAIALSAQVNNYALSEFLFGSGAGSFSQSGSTFYLNYGTLSQGTGIFSTTLFAENGAAGPADLLNGTFAFLDKQDFGEIGFNPFADLAAGAQTGSLTLKFDTSALGTFSDTIILHGIGHNSGYSAPIGDITLVVQGSVVEGGQPVPEPSTWILLVSGLGTLAWIRRMRKMSKGE